MKTYLAIDIGASSGRHISGSIINGRLCLKEIYRFPNSAKMKGGHLCWELETLRENIVKGLKAAKDAAPISVGVDTWGVDFVLLDKNDQILGEAVAYRDNRTEGMDQRFEKKMSMETLYAHTGIARQPYNTLYQLMAIPAEQLREVRTFLMMPDYLHFTLCGIKSNEYSEASTTALLNAKTRIWDPDVLKAAEIPVSIFSAPLLKSGSILGRLSSSIREKVGFDTTVVTPASHDTGSAYIAVPAQDENAVYLSSGTWSLLGVENKVPLSSNECMAAGFTNEGGYGGTYRFLKNIMGLWILQSIRKEQKEKYTFAEMASLAGEASDFEGRFDANTSRFLAPAHMIDEITTDLTEHDQPIPKTDGELFACVIRSLADCYKESIHELEHLTGKQFTSINIVGGGSQNAVLNQWTADASGLPVYAGPTEGTALGNIIAQMITSGEIKDIATARRLIAESFDVKEFLPGRV